MSKPGCSIVIRAYNEEEHIGRLLSGILEQSLKVPEIILVDSGSTDATVSIAERYPVKVVRISPDEFSFGRALNLGISRAISDLIVMASAHVYPVYQDWLERLLEPFENPRVALSYGRQRGDAETRFSEQQVFAKWFPDKSVELQQHPFCNNANAAIRRDLWEIHPYAEDLTGLEDLEWGSWALQEGYGISYVAEAVVVHVHDEQPSQLFNRYRREAMAMRKIFPGERFGFLEFLVLFTTNVATDFWHAVQARKAISSGFDILRFRFLQFWGTFQGYRMSGPLSGRLKRVFYYPRGIGLSGTDSKREAARIVYSAQREGGAEREPSGHD